MAEGRLSYAKVRALSRVANEATEGDLLNFALCGTALQAAEDSLPIPKHVSAETS